LPEHARSQVVYAFLQGAWPLGFVEIVFTIVALRRFAARLKTA